MAYGNDNSDGSALSDEAIKAKLAEIYEALAALESGKLPNALPVEELSKVKIVDLRRQIVMYHSILERRAYSRTSRRAVSFAKGGSEVTADFSRAKQQCISSQNSE